MFYLQNVYPSIVILVFKVMSWPDTKACGLSAMLAWKIVKPVSFDLSL